jgi:hypothetical protein
VEAHLGSDFFEGFGAEVGCARPGFQRAERVLDGGAADTHGIEHAVEPILHGVDRGVIDTNIDMT